MDRLLTGLVSTLLLPPAGPLLIAIVGLVLLRRSRRAGIALAITGVAALWLMSLGVVGNTLLRTLEPAPITKHELARVQAIVVVGGGLNPHSPEYGEAVLANESLARVRYAARLGRESGIPVLVSAGNPFGETPEAEAMARIMKTEFGLEPRWVEKSSATTAENAALSYAILAPQRLTRIALVTTARHMPRAARSFRAAGFEVVPAATGYVPRSAPGLFDFLPTADGLAQTRSALREWMGSAWYALRR